MGIRGAREATEAVTRNAQAIRNAFRARLKSSGGSDSKRMGLPSMGCPNERSVA